MPLQTWLVLVVPPEASDYHGQLQLMMVVHLSSSTMWSVTMGLGLRLSELYFATSQTLWRLICRHWGVYIPFMILYNVPHAKCPDFFNYQEAFRDYSSGICLFLQLNQHAFGLQNSSFSKSQ